MKRFALSIALLSTAAVAQQAAPVVTYSPVTIDGQTTANGLVTVNGQPYVSVAALAKSQVTVLSPHALGIYAFPVAPGTSPVKLKGCINEWLTDGTTRVRVTDYSLGSGWEVALQWQTTQTDVVAFDNVFHSDQALFVLKNGKAFDAKVDRFVRTVSDVAATTRGGLDGGAMAFFGANLTEKNPPVRMVLRPLNGAPWTFDLSCKR